MHRSRQPRLSRALPWFRQCLASDPHATWPFHMAFPHLKSVILIPLASHLPPFCHRGTSVSTHKPTSLQPQSPRPGLLQKSATKPAAPRRLCLVLPCTTTIGVFHLATPPRNIPSFIYTFSFPASVLSSGGPVERSGAMYPPTFGRILRSVWGESGQMACDTAPRPASPHG